VCCDQLLCARCAGPVSDGRCATCRAARAELHPGLTAPLLPYALLVALVLALLLAAALHS
jgi:hypothetical protein